MTAYEFGFVVGAFEKQSAPVADIMPSPVNFRLGGNLPSVVPGQGVKGAPVRDFARQTLEAGKRLATPAAQAIGRGASTVAKDVATALPGGRALVGLAGVGGLLGGAMGGVEGAGRGVGQAVGLGAGGGLGAGLGMSVSRLLPKQYQNAAQIAGGTLGAVGGLLGARKMMGAPAAAKQAGYVADMAQGVKDKTKALASKIEPAAKTVANKAVDAGKKMQTNFENWRNKK